MGLVPREPVFGVSDKVRFLPPCSVSYRDYTVELQWVKLTHPVQLELSSWSQQVMLCIIHPGWLKLPLARTIFHSPKPVRAIEVLL